VLSKPYSVRLSLHCELSIDSHTLSDIVALLDAKALPYVIFLVVPVLGRMSDSDDDIRSISTNTFASLVKMVPLEVRQEVICLHFFSKF
jgi:hypothetical protein